MLAGPVRWPPVRTVGAALLAFTAWVLVSVTLLRPVLAWAVAWPLTARAFLVALWLSPAGLALGMPFVTALRALRDETPALVPWAWGVNACASVLAPCLTVLIAMQAGFRMTLLVALAVYWAGFATWRGKNS